MADLFLWLIGMLVVIIIWLNPLSPKPSKEKPTKPNLSYEVTPVLHYYSDEDSSLFVGITVTNTGDADAVMRDFRLTKLVPEYLKDHLTTVQGVAIGIFKHNVPPVTIQPQLWFRRYLLTEEEEITVEFTFEYLDGTVDKVESVSEFETG